MEQTSWYGKAVLEECLRLRKSLQPISEQYHGPLEQAAAGNTLYPFVLLLGNHSSGKSSFINYILNRKVQMTGVAPTDDNFTIIGHGEEDIDRSGPAFVGSDLGFDGLRNFGPVLVNHTQLKVRSDIAVKDFMLVDTPGMIDSPVSRNSIEENLMDRGYNFENVCRWYAERADVILLFFDPDKPGTTGETLSILTNSLVGFDHKLLIILNKADQFRRIHDFARAYGSLCWNLSKVIPRKDLPRIHTMCLPSHALTQQPSEVVPNSDDAPPSPTAITTTATTATATVGHTPSNNNSGKSFFDQGILDLEEGRTEVIREAFNAPKRRVDNEISRLYENVTALNMHLHIVDEIARLYHDELWRARLWSFGSLALSVGAMVGVHMLCDRLAATATASASVPDSPSSSPSTGASSTGATTAKAAAASGSIINPSTAGKLEPSLALRSAANIPTATKSISIKDLIVNNRQVLLLSTGAVGTLTTAAITLWRYTSLHYHLQAYKKRSTFEDIVKTLYAKELTANDAFTTAVASQVIEHMPVNVTPVVIQTLQRVPKKDFLALNRIIHDDIANLRRRASPSFPVISPPPKHSAMDGFGSVHATYTPVTPLNRRAEDGEDGGDEAEAYSTTVDVGERSSVRTGGSDRGSDRGSERGSDRGGSERGDSVERATVSEDEHETVSV